MERATELRCTGRTTRMVDRYVQVLFDNMCGENKMIEIQDHFPSPNASRDLINKIKRRVKIEHHIDCEVCGNRMRFINPNIKGLV